MNKLLTLVLLTMSMDLFAQKSSPKATIERITIQYKGKQVKAKKLIVTSEIPMDIESAWKNVKTPALLQFVAKGMIRFVPGADGFPEKWEAHKNYTTKMRVFGFIPFGGTHHLYIDTINDTHYIIATKEWDKSAKVWNHTIILEQLDINKTHYIDEIVIYGGGMTSFITSFAKKFYKHRQRRWQLVAKDALHFDE